MNIDQPATTPRHRKEVRDVLPQAVLSLEPEQECQQESTPVTLRDRGSAFL
ncbi:hypothetical protein [Streptomyces canus]|uniref:hypothetical protein n=1 Tax=Streptomyces canus TaxID=58343 RepID=UPI003248EE1C